MQSNVASETVAGLRKMFATDDAARKFFLWAANRQNDATQTSIDYLAAKAGADRKRALEIAKELEELGCGTFMVGRRGAKSRIIWDASLKSIGSAAAGTSPEVQSLDPELKAETNDLKDESGQGLSLTIPEAKKRLAETLGITPNAIEIIVRA